MESPRGKYVISPTVSSNYAVCVWFLMLSIIAFELNVIYVNMEEYETTAKRSLSLYGYNAVCRMKYRTSSHYIISKQFLCAVMRSCSVDMRYLAIAYYRSLSRLNTEFSPP